jgi:prepilin-type N-terminal cleavage/methylation domain-containing protein
MRMRAGAEPSTGSRITAARRGMTLLEVVIALTIFAVCTASIAGMTGYVARGSRLNGIATARSAALAAQINRLEVLPFDTLPSRAGCTSVSAGQVPRTECVSVTDLSPTRRRVTFIQRPSNTALRPDTVIFERSKPAAFNPFNLL